MESRPMKGKHREIKIEAVYDVENIRAADKEARIGKSRNYGVNKFDRNKEKNIEYLHKSLKDETYKTSKPKIEARYCDKKVRVLSKVNYIDHVAHHALMRVIMPILDKYIYYDSAASIKGRGIHYAAKHVEKYIRLANCDLWHAQLDFIKCYHNVVREKLYAKLCKVFTNRGIRRLLRDIIWALGKHNGLTESDGTRGVGIGLYPIQPLVNFYFSDLGRLVSRYTNTKIFIYCDNIQLISKSPEDLYKAIELVKWYAKEVVDQPIHQNVGIQKLDEVHPINFVGYLFYKDHTLVRKETKYRFKRKFKQSEGVKLLRVLSSYKGWLEFCDGLHLWNVVTHMNRFSDLNLVKKPKLVQGRKFFEVGTISLKTLVDKLIVLKDFESNIETEYGDGRAYVLINWQGQDYKFCTADNDLIDTLTQIKEMDKFPVEATVKRDLNSGVINKYYFE